MSKSYTKSAKDLAFDKERAKYAKTIKELERSLKDKDNEIAQYKNYIEGYKSEIDELKEWVGRLLEYTEMSEEDLRAFIVKEKKEAELVNKLSSRINMAEKLFRGTYFGL